MIDDYVIALKLTRMADGAKKRGIPFSLTFSKLKQLMQRKKCFYTKINFSNSGEEYAKSIDRVDSTKGYTNDNVVACTVVFNNLKANMSVEDLQICMNTVLKLKQSPC